MPKDFFVFLLLIGAVISLRFLNVSPGVRLFLFALLACGQVAFIMYGLLHRPRPGRDRRDD